jgi:hypothetical protein
MLLMRRLRNVAIGLLVLYTALSAGLLVIMREPIRFGRVMRHVPDPAMMVFPFKSLWFIARAGRLHVGDMAPEFNLLTGDRTGHFELASLRGQRSVVLVFGSYT